MNKYEIKGSPFKNKENIRHIFNQWPLVVAFISGMVFTAGVVQVLVSVNVTSYQENNIPAPQNQPGTPEPGFLPRFSPAEYGINGLA